MNENLGDVLTESCRRINEAARKAILEEENYILMKKL
jgi:hypothetical protein